jgi:hypothetical protein
MLLSSFPEKKQDFFGARHYLQQTLYSTLYLTYYFKLRSVKSVKQYFTRPFTRNAGDDLRLPY